MQSLMLGVVAALLWGLHDFTIRRVAARSDAAALYLVVLGFGAILLAPVALIAGGWAVFTPGMLGFCAVAGLVYAFGVYALYRAYILGPVRLVAPICGAFPLISVAIAALRGQETGLVVWLASGAVLLGIGVVAQGEAGDAQGSRRAAITWSVLAALGFAFSFELLHHGAQMAGEIPVTLIARLAGFGGVLAWVISQRIDLKPAFAIWPTLLMMGALDVAGMLAVTMAGSFARPEFASVASSCFGLVTILLAWRFLREPMTAAQWLGVGLVFAGVTVLGLV